MYRLLSIEDDPAEEAALRELVERYATSHNVELDLAWERSSFDFVGAETHYDLVFLDIDLPGINGMETAALLRGYDSQTPIIFVTNLAQYAVKGYEVDALDFMVKPVGYQDFCLRMNRALRVVRRNAEKVVAVATSDGTHLVDEHDVSYVDIVDHEAVFHMVGGEELRSRVTLKSLEQALSPERFARVSNNALVNIGSIRRVGRDSLTMDTGDEVFFSRSRKQTALEAIGRYVGASV